MTKQEFNKLTLTQKGDLCWSDGEYINWVQYNEQKALLFLVRSHYVEMYYSTKDKTVSSIEILENPTRLVHYTQSVDILDAY